jgi:Mg2+/citrate symporter
MYLVAIAWLYVAMMLSIGARSVTTGVLTFLFAGVLPCALILWMFGSPRRRRIRKEQEAQQSADESDAEATSNSALSEEAAVKDAKD